MVLNHLKQYFCSHVWDTEGCSNDWFLSYEMFYFRKCIKCGFEERKEISLEEQQKIKKEQQEEQQKYWREQEEKRQANLTKLKENPVLDRRGNKIYPNTHVWYEGQEYLIYDSNPCGERTCVLELFPAKLIGAAVNVGYGCVRTDSSVVVALDKIDSREESNCAVYY